METAIRFSQNSTPGSAEQRFLSVDVTNKLFKLCCATSSVQRHSSSVTYSTEAASSKVPSFRAFDWHPHPSHEDLVAVGQSSGEATLLKLIKPGETDPGPVSFQVRSQRSCNAVSISSEHLLAAGLERVRTDYCLNIWDFSHRIPSTGANISSPKSPNYAKSQEPLHKLASGDPITSLKFFPTNPLHLVAGSRGQWVKLFDLRESNHVSNAGLQFNTRCIHNLAIDWQDENFFASCFPTSPEATVVLWDRRMMARGNVTSSGYSSHDGKQPEASLELKHTIDGGNIWSLRFSKSQRGSLGVLSSTGQLRVYDLCKDSVTEEYKALDEGESEWETQFPQETFLDRAHDIEKPMEQKSTSSTSGGAHTTRVVSFDFTTSSNAQGQPVLITLNAEGGVGTTSTAALPEPTSIHSSGFIAHGNKYVHAGNASDKTLEGLHDAARAIEARSDRKASESSISAQHHNADLRFSDNRTSIVDLLSMESIPRIRCESGYLLDSALNKTLAAGNSWLQGLWDGIARADHLHKSSLLVHENLDLSYLGIHSIWNEDIPSAEMSARSLDTAPDTNGKRLSRTIEGIVRRLQLPANRHVRTEHHFSRQLSLYLSDLSWSTSELETHCKTLVSQSETSKAAFLALLSNAVPLAVRSLNAPQASKDDKFLALALASCARLRPQGRRQPVSTQEDASLDSDDGSDGSSGPEDGESEAVTSFLQAISDTLATTSEPYAAAILHYVHAAVTPTTTATPWPTVLANATTLPLKHRLAVALRHLPDSALTAYITTETTRAIADGDIEGIHLTGTGTAQAIDLLQNYIARFGADALQTSVLATARTVPRYMGDEVMLRRIRAWRQAYRAMIMSWGSDFRFKRVAFDVALARVAREGGVVPEVAKPQVRIVCAGCGAGLAHHEAGSEAGAAGGQGGKSSTGAGPGAGKGKTADGNTNPLNPATAAALGTVCPNCQRKMPHCGVCDHPLGQSDESYMKWYGRDANGRVRASVDAAVSERMAGSVGTIVGVEGRRERERGSGSVVGGAGSVKKEIVEGAVVDGVVEEEGVGGEETEADKARRVDQMMARFVVVCTRCSHSFHSHHARMWFEGDAVAGTRAHQICPVPKCECMCYG
jgi:WD repeat-containing protein mio